MRTLTTVEHVEKTEKGAYVVTFLGGNKAGTFDEAMGSVAEQALADGHSVALEVERREGSKLFIVEIALILPPEELGGPPEETPDGGKTDVTPNGGEEVSGQALVEPFAPEAAPFEPTLSSASDDELLAEIANRLADHG